LRDVGLSHLKANLVLDIPWMLEGGLVEDEDVRQRCEDVVDENAKDPVYLGQQFL
jgi:hypothetical protein